MGCRALDRRLVEVARMFGTTTVLHKGAKTGAVLHRCTFITYDELRQG
jgi:hypothetical protein